MIIYKVTNNVNGKIYIGLTVRDFRARKLQHINDAKRDSKLVFHRALRKYGFDNFEWEIIDTAETQEELNKKEKYWIDFYKSYIHAKNSNGYNTTIGGEGMSGFKLSDETKKKLSDANKGKKATDETKRKMSESSKGMIHSDESKKKISDANKGSNHHRTNLSDEDVLQIKELIKSGIKQDDIADEFNVDPATISAIKQGKNWSHIGEDVSYVEYSKIKYSKLTDDDVKEIKLLLIEGSLSQKEIGKMYGVTNGMINDINTGKRWKYVGEDLSCVKSKYQKEKMTEDKVREIKILLKEGNLTQTAIAEMYEVDFRLVSKIKTGRSWKHVEIA